MFRSTWRHTQPFCKVHFTIFTFFAFFLITIRYISQKCNTFAPNLKNATKLVQNFKINDIYLHFGSNDK